MHKARSVLLWTSLLSQRKQFGLNCKKDIALKIAYKILHYLPKITLHKGPPD